MMRWLKCRDAAKLSSQKLDRELAFGERVSLRVHLAICDGCTNFSKQLAFLRAAIARLGSREP
jgi:hypothetical protein